MRFLPYVLAHLGRSWLRTLSTIFGMALCIFLICTLQTILAAMDASVKGASPNRLATRHAVSLVFNMPNAYKSRISAIPGIRRVARTNFFGGLPGGGGSQDFANFFANFAVEPEPYFAMYPEFQVPARQWDDFLSKRRGAIIGRALATRFGWDLGDSFQLESFIPPYRVGKPFEFIVTGIFDIDVARYPGVSEMQMFFHYDYLNEATRMRAGVGTFMVQINDASHTAEIAKLIDDTFENSDVQTKTETEGAFIQGFNELAGNLVLLLNAIGLAVGFTVLIVTANTMSMAVRERKNEIAVLKTLGFSSARVMGLILTEALILATTAGVVGVGLANAIVSNLAKVPILGAVLGNFPALVLSPELAGVMFGSTVALGLAAGLLPAWTAYRARIVDTLRAA
jgi:putative ABC transport system permease protein